MSMLALVQLAHHFAHHPVAGGLRDRRRRRRRPHSSQPRRAEPVRTRGVVGGEPVLRHEALSLSPSGSSGKLAAHTRDRLLRSRAARAGRAPGSSGSRAPLPCCASPTRVLAAGSHRRVSCVTRPPSSRILVWRSNSNSMACSTCLNEFRFLTSVLTPSSSTRSCAPTGSRRSADSPLPCCRRRSRGSARASAASADTRLASRGRANVGFADDFDQRDAAAVDVDQAVVGAVDVDQLAGVLFEVNARMRMCMRVVLESRWPFAHSGVSNCEIW